MRLGSSAGLSESDLWVYGIAKQRIRATPYSEPEFAFVRGTNRTASNGGRMRGTDADMGMLFRFLAPVSCISSIDSHGLTLLKGLRPCEG